MNRLRTLALQGLGLYRSSSRLQRAGWAIYYCVAIWITVAMIAFALDWKSLKSLPDHYIYTGMQWFEGPITSVRTSGWGKFKNYILRINNSETEVVLPKGIMTGAWTQDKMP